MKKQTLFCLKCNSMRLNEIKFNFVFSIQTSLMWQASCGRELRLGSLLSLAVNDM